MNQTMDTAKRQISELGAMAEQGKRMDKSILTAAISRLESIEEKLKELDVHGILSSYESADKYRELIHERGLLHQVISRARQVAGGSH